jgi:phosphoribosylaminoimidazolecarboxamide formyltransferase / IMP cyclohydrolase
MKILPRYALVSVTDKSELIPLIQDLVSLGINIISTGGTAKVLSAAGIDVISIEDITGNPEAFGGRMKSISFQVASGLLYRRGHPEDEKEANDLGIPGIDLVVCNLYNFEDQVGKTSPETSLVEQIDIGGPLMIRAAAKNYFSVTVLSSHSQYRKFSNHLKEHAGTTLEFRRQLACEAFDRIARYDIAIAEELGSRFNPEREEKFISLRKVQHLRYGENPHQEATWYDWKNAATSGLGGCKIIQGKELSYNNLLDADAAWKVTSDVHGISHSGFTAAVIKHGNPCGLAHGENPLISLIEAWRGDETSAFGGIVAMAFDVTAEIASFFEDRFVEILMAPKFTEEAKLILAKKKNVRLLELPLRAIESHEKTMRSFHGGILIQDEDESLRDVSLCEIKTKNKFTQKQHQLVSFGVVACKHLKSNGIALVAENNGVLALVGAGMGQPNRLDSLHLLAGHRASRKEIDFKNVVLVSDAFFPFADSIQAADKYGIKYIVQPGGSIRDEEVISKADELGIAMIFTGERHFRH